MLKVRAKSKGGSIHVLIGTVKNREVVPFTSYRQAVAHCEKNGWEVLDRIVVKPDGNIETTPHSKKLLNNVLEEAADERRK